MIKTSIHCEICITLKSTLEKYQPYGFGLTWSPVLIIECYTDYAMYMYYCLYINLSHKKMNHVDLIFRGRIKQWNFIAPPPFVPKGYRFQVNTVSIEDLYL